MPFWKLKDKSAPADPTLPTYQTLVDKQPKMGHRFAKLRRDEKPVPPCHISQLPKSEQRERIQARSLWTPPPYSSTPEKPSSVGAAYTGAADSPYAFLGEFDTIFLVDDSSSMLGQRWREAEEAIAAIAPICTMYDRDGIDIYFLNHRRQSAADTAGGYANVTTAAGVQEIFSSIQPRGATPFGKRLLEILRPYLRRVEQMAAATDFNGVLADPSLFVKPLNIIAITDGAFTDDAESVIVSTAKTLDSPRCRAVPWQVGIQFFQIGTDEVAAQYLQELDDELGKRARDEDLRDIVDTVPWRGQLGQTLNAPGIMKCVLGAVHKKYDRRDGFN